jgi:hypothetical protein
MELSFAELCEILGTGVLDKAESNVKWNDRAVIIRTVTHYYVGKLIGENDKWLFLTDCSWIADTGRWSTALSTGSLNEVEPYPSDSVVQISIGAVVDLSDWKHEIPRSVK